MRQFFFFLKHCCFSLTSLMQAYLFWIIFLWSFSSEGCILLTIACCTAGCWNQPPLMGFSTIFHMQLHWACWLFFNKKLYRPLPVSICSSSWPVLTYYSVYASSFLFTDLHLFKWVWRWWRYLLFYAGLNIIILYTYQLPIELSSMFQWIANFLGLYKVTSKSEWSQFCSGLSLVLFYFMVRQFHLGFDLCPVLFLQID